MMKHLFIFLILFTIGVSSQAQSKLTNTKWAGVAYVPSAADIEFVFKKDSVSMIYEGEVFELMTYKVKGDTLLLTKLEGNSPCSDEVGMYKFEIKDNRLFIKLLKDDCEPRGAAFSAEGYLRKND